MTKVEMCENLGILGDVRQRLGANDEDNTSFKVFCVDLDTVEVTAA